MPATTAAGVGLANPADALAAATRGGAFLFLGVPPGTAFTIDGVAFISGPSFQGLKMVPPGAHQVCYAAREAGSGAPGPVSSFWVWVDVAKAAPGREGAPPPAQSIVVRRWNPATELLEPLGDDGEEAARYAAGVSRFDFDAGLAPYGLRGWAAWRKLAGHIDAASLARLAPPGIPGGTVSVIAEADPGSGGGGEGRPRPPTPAEAALESALAAGRARTGRSEAGDAGGGLAARAPGLLLGTPPYTRLPRLVGVRRPPGGPAPAPAAAPVPSSTTSAAALTAANLDKTGTLTSIIAAPPFRGDRGAGLLAEFQHAFLTFWAGQSLAAYGAWKAALHLALGCVRGPRDPGTAPFFAALLTALAAQLEASLGKGEGGGGGGGGGGGDSRQPAPADGPFGLPMVDELMADSFLRALVRRFLVRLRQESEDADGALPPVPQPVRAAAAGLAGVVQARLGWEVGGGEAEEEEDEDGPVVVDADGNY